MDGILLTLCFRCSISLMEVVSSSIFCSTSLSVVVPSSLSELVFIVSCETPAPFGLSCRNRIRLAPSLAFSVVRRVWSFLSSWRLPRRSDYFALSYWANRDVKGAVTSPRLRWGFRLTYTGMRKWCIQNEEMHLGVPELHNRIITLMSMYWVIYCLSN